MSEGAALLLVTFGVALGYLAGRTDRTDLGSLRRRRKPRVYVVPTDRLLWEARRRGRLRPVQ